MKQKKRNQLENQPIARNAISTFQENPGIIEIMNITVPRGVGN